MAEEGAIQKTRGDSTQGPLQIDVLALPHKVLLLAYNDDSEASRSTLLLAISTNEGESWHNAAVLEADPRGSFHYPTLLYHKEQAGLYQQVRCKHLLKVHSKPVPGWECSSM